jgi:hypothetical protein
MKALIKLIVGLLAHGFILSMIFFLGFLFPKILQLTQSHVSELPPEFAIYIPLALVAALSVFVPMGLFVGYVLKHPGFSSTGRIVWVLALVLANAIAVPIFFWVVFIKHPNDQPFFKHNQPLAHA